jgi:hypothetical protein
VLIDNGANTDKLYTGNETGRECQAYAKSIQSKYVDVTVRMMRTDCIFVNGVVRPFETETVTDLINQWRISK